MWIYEGKELKEEEISSKSIGYLYKITHIPSGNFYYGRKLLTKAAYKQVNGKKKKVRKESDWKDYYSSSPTLVALVEKDGKESFKREVLLFVETKAAFTYGEEYILYRSGALFDQNCLNGNIRSRIQRNWFGKCPDLHNQLEAIML